MKQKTLALHGTTVWVVNGEHPYVPNLRLSVHATPELADAGAAELVEIIRKDVGVRGPKATAKNWRTVLAKIQKREDDCRVEVSELPLVGKPMFTVFCQDATRTGTTYVDSTEADTWEQAAAVVRDRCAKDWGQPAEDVAVIGVASGDVTIVAWDDEGSLIPG